MGLIQDLITLKLIDKIFDKMIEILQGLGLLLFLMLIGYLKNLPAGIVFTLPFYLYFRFKQQRKPFYSLLLVVTFFLIVTDVIWASYFTLTEPTEYDFRYDPKGEASGDNVDWDSLKVTRSEWILDYGCWCNDIFLLDTDKPFTKRVIYFGNEIQIGGVNTFSCWWTFWWGCGILILLLLYYYVKGKLLKPKET